MTTPVSIVRSIPSNCEAIVPLLRAQLEIVEEASEHGTVVLVAHLPGNGRVAAPVRLRVSYPGPKSPRFGVAIAARSTPWMYPQFRGALELAPAGTASTTLTLSGAYQVPLGVLGRAFDATAARGIAPRGLADFLDGLAANVAAAIASDAEPSS